MWSKLVIGLMLGFASAASGADHDDRDRHDRGGQQGFRAPAAVSAPSRINRVEQRPIYRVQPQSQPQPLRQVETQSIRRVEPRPMVSGTPTFDRSRVGTNQTQVQEWSGSRGRDTGRHDRDHDFHGHWGNNNHSSNTGTTVFFSYYPYYPYYPYYFNNGYNNYNSYPYGNTYSNPYDNYYDNSYGSSYGSSNGSSYGNSYGESPSVYFICYQADRIEGNRFHVSCPYQMAWYSTDPYYSSYEYQSNYRPEYVCPNYGTSYFREFNSAYEATTWWNNVCNTWQPLPANGGY